MTQLGFDDLLQTAAQHNAVRVFEQETAHLPGCFEGAVPFFREVIEQHDQAMREANVAQVMHLREEAHLLARKLNGGDPGILANDGAPAYRLERSFAPNEGCEPLWGQAGKFNISVGDMEVEIDLHGVFGIGGCYSFWPGFAARAVHRSKPFLSQTGYRSFLGIQAVPQAGMTPSSFAQIVIQEYVTSELNGKLVEISDQFRG